MISEIERPKPPARRSRPICCSVWVTFCRVEVSGLGTRIGRHALVPTVGLAHICVGAHLRLDVAGGFAVGLTIDAIPQTLPC